MKKVALVTGSNKGLGLALVKGLCERFDGTVYMTSRDEARGQLAVEELENLGLKPCYHQLDITDNDSVQEFYKYIKNKHTYVDLLINNAGVLFLEDAEEPLVYRAEQTMLVNYFSVVNFTETMLPLMRHGGKIINISSSSGHLSRIPSTSIREKLMNTDAVEELNRLMKEYLEAVKCSRDVIDGWGESPYVVSKVGVNAYTFILHRKLLSKDISVSCVHPGYVASDMTRGAGSLTPEQGAEAPLHLVFNTDAKGLYIWYNKTEVPWHGADPRVYIDGKEV